MKRAVLVVLAVLIVVALLITAETPGDNQPLAQVGSETITAAEVRKALGLELAQAEEHVYELKRDKLDELIEEKLLAQEAARRGMTVDKLLEVEVNAKADWASDEEVEHLYEVNKDRFKGDAEQLRQRIRDYLQDRNRQERRKAFVASLRAEANVTVHLTPPEPFRAEVPIDGAPMRGNPSARVTLVKFEDFHCPYCRRLQPTLAQLLLRYGDDLRIVHRDFPLDSVHPLARRSHEAARCAGEQDKFWAYHDVLFANPPATTDDQLKEFAKEVGLDMPAFEECLQSGKYKAAIQADVDLGLKLGLTGTPSIFIDGRLLSGAQPMENFVAVIDEELKGTR
jgi:protein-disulfide isomerase